MSASWLIVVIIAAAVLAAGAIIVIYNRLVAGREHAREGWSGIDVQLKRRADLIPNLVDTVQRYAVHEREVLQQVTETRARVQQAQSAGPAERQVAENALSGALMRLFAVAEAYPELKADSTFLELQRNLSELENQIQMARRYYNGTARELNILIRTFPSNLVATWFGFQPVEYFEIEDPADRAVPRVGAAPAA